MGRMVLKTPRKPAGFLYPGDKDAPDPPEWVTPDREGHIISVAPTGSGKGASHLIPTLLA